MDILKVVSFIFIYSILFSFSFGLPEDMLQVVGKLLQGARWLIRGITFDGHLANTFFREALRGHFHALKEEDLRTVPFFNEVRYQDMPLHPLPRLPMRICTFQNEPVWGISGCCHAAKNTGGQIVSPIRSIFMGCYVVDTTHMLKLGLPPASYMRHCAMSDKLQATMNNPFFLVESAEVAACSSHLKPFLSFSILIW